MSYVNLVDSQLAKAFRLLKDLAVDVQLVKKESSGFNFATALPTVAAQPPITVKGVITETVQPTRRSKLLKKTLLLRSKDTGTLSAYTTMSLEGFSWQIEQVVKDSGRILVVVLAREA